MADQNRSERLASAFKRLVSTANDYNAASAEFSKPVLQIEESVEPLNLRLTTWKKIVGGADDYGNYWSRDVGYTRVNGRWRIVVRAMSGNYNVEEADEYELWPFDEAPQSYRIEALDKLPDLLEELIKNAEKTAKKLKELTPDAKELAAAVKQATKEVQKERR